MQLHPYVDQIRSQLVAAATLGDDRTRQTAEVLATACEPAVRLAVLAAVSAAADEITAALLDAPVPAGVSVRLDGDELHSEVRLAEPPPEAEQPAGGATAEDTDTSARISLRLSENLKSQIEGAARADSVSVNTWLIRAAGRALQPGPEPGGWGTWPGAGGRLGWDQMFGGKESGRRPHRITGWING